jgi:hypothetical protein
MRAGERRLAPAARAHTPPANRPVNRPDRRRSDQAAALVDRLVHHAHIVAEGKSYRLRERGTAREPNPPRTLNEHSSQSQRP